MWPPSRKMFTFEEAVFAAFARQQAGACEVQRVSGSSGGGGGNSLIRLSTIVRVDEQKVYHAARVSRVQRHLEGRTLVLVTDVGLERFKVIEYVDTVRTRIRTRKTFSRFWTAIKVWIVNVASVSPFMKRECTCEKKRISMT